MRQNIEAFLLREEAALAPYAVAALGAGAAAIDTMLSTAHPSGQTDIALVMLASLVTKGVIVWARKRNPPPAAP
jgi:hypothetical protein